MRAVDEKSATTPAADWKVAGTSVLKVVGRVFVCGKHKYASDVKLPGMLFGKMLRATGLDATLVSVDTKAAEAMTGVTVVRDGNFIGMTAPDALTAEKAIEAMRAEWSVPPQPSSEEIYDYLRQNVSEGGGRGGGSAHNAGAMEDGLAAAAEKVEAEL